MEENISDDHLHIIGNSGNIQICQVADEFLDNLLLLRSFFLIDLIDTEINEKVGESSLIIRFVFNLRDIFFIFFEKEIDPEIFMIMIFQCPLIRIGDDINDRFTLLTDFGIDRF